jgi:hypothetical protein
LDPEVLRFQDRIINRWILDRNILEMKTAPRCEADTKNRDRVAEVFADDFPQSQLSVRGLDVKIDGQQSQPDQPDDCNEDDQRCLNNRFHMPSQNARAIAREYSPDGQEKALDSQADQSAKRKKRLLQGSLGQVAKSAALSSAQFTERSQESEIQSVSRDFTVVVTVGGEKFSHNPVCAVKAVDARFGVPKVLSASFFVPNSF